MATFYQKQWEDRDSDYPNRRILTDVSTGTTQTVMVERDEGQIQKQGDLFNASNMNGLEGRIAAAINALTADFQDGVDKIYNALVAQDITPSASTPEAIMAAINNIKKGGDAVASDVLFNKTGYVNGQPITGTMTNKGAWIGDAPTTGGIIKIPEGYHNGSGYVNCNTAFQGGRSQGQSDPTSKYTKLMMMRTLGYGSKGFQFTYYPKGWYHGNPWEIYLENVAQYGHVYRLTVGFNASFNGELTDFSYTVQQLT